MKTVFHAVQKPVDVLLIKNGTDPFIDQTFFYLTGLEHGLFEGSYLIGYHDGSLHLIVSELESHTAQHTGFPLSVYSSKKDVETLLKQVVGTVRHIGLHFSALTHHDALALHTMFPSASFTDISPAIQRTRLIKDTQEVETIREACRIADKVMQKIPGVIHKGLKEYELAAEIDYHLQKYGATRPAFTTISSFGAHAAEPHYTHGDTMLHTGEVVLCDFGANYRGYNSDITRTFICGKATPQHMEMYRTVEHAQQIGFDSIRPGATASDVHHAVAASIDKTPFRGTFIHSTGHALGLSVHDGPGFSTESTLQLQEGMVFTVEPGVYLPGIGGVRIEDDIVVTKKGVDILTKSPRHLQELE